MPGRNGVDDGVVHIAVVLAVQRLIADAVRQRLLPALDPRSRIRRAARVLADEIAQPLALDRLIVDVEQPVLDLDPVARQPNDPLDVVGGVVPWQAKHHDVAAVRLRAEDATREDVRRERDRIMAVAVGIFRDEQIVADQERRLHRPRGNVERLEQEGADDERDQKGMDDDADGFAQAALRFGPGGHAHCFPNSRGLMSTRWQNVLFARSVRPSREENGLDSDLEGKFRPKPEIRVSLDIPCGVLDGCLRRCNQSPPQNFAIH